MNREQKFFIEQTLRKFKFVRWDRFFTFGDDGLFVFGWINRLKDQYKDFVTLEFNLKEKVIAFWATSSSVRSKEIVEILDVEHNDCQRVEKRFDIENCINLDGD